MNDFIWMLKNGYSSAWMVVVFAVLTVIGLVVQLVRGITDQ